MLGDSLLAFTVEPNQAHMNAQLRDADTHQIIGDSTLLLKETIEPEKHNSG
jgi:hypothetical protein